MSTNGLESDRWLQKIVLTFIYRNLKVGLCLHSQRIHNKLVTTSFTTCWEPLQQPQQGERLLWVDLSTLLWPEYNLLWRCCECRHKPTLSWKLYKPNEWKLYKHDKWWMVHKIKLRGCVWDFQARGESNPFHCFQIPMKYDGSSS